MTREDLLLNEGQQSAYNMIEPLPDNERNKRPIVFQALHRVATLKLERLTILDALSTPQERESYLAELEAMNITE